MTFLLTTICNGTLAEEMRSMAAVLLRRLFASEFMDFYPKVDYFFFMFLYYLIIKILFIKIHFSIRIINQYIIISDPTRSTSSIERTNFIISSN